MLVIVTSPLPAELSATPGIKPWHFQKKRSWRTARALRATAGRLDCVVPLTEEPKLGSTGLAGTSTRLRDFGGGCYCFGVDKASWSYARTDERDTCGWLLSRRNDLNGDLLLGFYSGKQHESYIPYAIDAGLLVSQSTTVFGHHIVIFLAHLLSSNGTVLMLRKGQKGLDSFVDTFSASGFERLPRTSAEQLISTTEKARPIE